MASSIDPIPRTNMHISSPPSDGSMRAKAMHDVSSAGNSSTRILSFSWLRILGTIAVITLHVLFTGAGIHEDDISDTQYIVTEMIVSLTMWAVPVFLMVSGTLLLDPSREISISKIFKKYLKRVLVALLLCSVLFRIIDIVMDGEPFTLFNLLVAFKELFTGDGWSHLWYLYLLVGIYLCLPFFRMIARHLDRQSTVLLIVLSVVFLSVLPTLEGFDLYSAFYIPMQTIYPFYFFLGYILKEYTVIKSDAVLTSSVGRNHGLYRKTAWTLLIVGMLLSLLFSWMSYQPGLENFSVFRNYYALPVVMQSVGIFMLFLHWKPARLPKIVALLDSQSFGIYLLHMILVRLILRYWSFNPYLYTGPMTILLYAVLIVLILFITLGVTLLLKKFLQFSF
jgi:surface polysaccharide O-acyltransferase-like enzyme